MDLRTHRSSVPGRMAAGVAAPSLVASLALVAVLLPFASRSAPAMVWERSVPELQADLDSRRLTARSLTRTYLERIHRLNPALRAVISVNPDALDAARRSDARRAAGHPLSPLDGVPILLKDNIDVAGLVTTAGSLALADNVALRNAPLAQRLLEAGLVILGKANMSEWANFRSAHAASGWSAKGGLTRNPYALDRSACGSSSGSAAAVAADLAPWAVGTETDGSITCPAAMNALVGLKPTVGLISRSGIVPISQSQDTAGPMARSVLEVAALLDILADPTALPRRPDYRAGLAAQSLRGARIGVMRFLKSFSPRTLAVFDAALDTLRAQGAVLVDIDAFEFGEMGTQERTVLLTEFKEGVNEYLAATPPAVSTRSLAALIEFNRTHPAELAWFDQDLFERAEATLGPLDQTYRDARRGARQHAGSDGIDRLLRDNAVVALVAPTTGPAWSIDWVNGDPSSPSAGKLPAVAGYPHLTVPMGQVAGLPVGISFIGPAWSEPLLLSFGFYFESATHARQPPPVPQVGRLPPRLGP